MKRLLFTFYFLLFTFYLFSQINILHNFNDNTIANDIDKLPNGNYIFSSESNYDAKLTIINENGNIQNQIILDVYSLPINTIEVKESNIYTLTIGAKMINDTAMYFLSLTCYSLNFDTIWNKNYFVDTTLVFSHDFIKTNDGGFAIAGSIDKGGWAFDALLLKTDSLGNLQWYKEYGYSNSEDLYSILQTPDSGYMLSGYSKKYNISNSDWYILRTDSLGNQIWDWVLHNPQGLSDGAVADLIQTQDGNFVAVGGQTYVNYPHPLQNARLLKFDINKNIILDTLFYEKYEDEGISDSTHSGFIKIKPLNNGNFLTIGYSQALSGDFWSLTSNLYIMDNDFNIISKRNYRSLPYGWGAEYIRDFIIEQNGSLTMIGDIHSNGATNPQQQVWFVKTDTNYCDGFGSCDTLKKIEFLIPDSINRSDTIKLKYKINSNFNINYDVRLIFYSGNKYSHVLDTIIYNIPVNTVDSSFNFSHNLLFGNNYDTIPFYNTAYIFYSLYPSDSLTCGKFNSHLSDNIIYFYTPDSSDGIKQLHNPEARISVYPNPCDGQLNVEYINIENASNINIYDIQGKIVITFNATPKFGFQTIDVSSLQKGTYLIGFGKGLTTQFVVK
jgi:hypothetical protein